MNMVSIGILFLLSIVIRAHAEEKQSFVKVECKTANVGQYGQQSMLECIVQTTKDVVEATIRVIIWKKKGSGDTLLFFKNGKTESKEGYNFAETSWNDRNMNISLLITNTAVVHDGDYECMVHTDSGGGSNFTSLSVRAKYSKPRIRSMPEKITRDEAVTLSCNSDGGFPKGQLHWLDVDNKDWTMSSKMEAEQTSDGLFKLTSNLHLAKNSIYSKYTCVVVNSSDRKEDETTLDIPATSPLGDGKGSDPASKIVAPVVVIGSLIVGLLVALLVYRKRSQQARRLSTTPLMSDHREVRASDSDIEDVAGLEMYKN